MSMYEIKRLVRNKRDRRLEFKHCVSFEKSAELFTFLDTRKSSRIFENSSFHIFENGSFLFNTIAYREAIKESRSKGNKISIADILETF